MTGLETFIEMLVHAGIDFEYLNSGDGSGSSVSVQNNEIDIDFDDYGRLEKIHTNKEEMKKNES